MLISWELLKDFIWEKNDTGYTILGLKNIQMEHIQIPDIR